MIPDLQLYHTYRNSGPVYKFYFAIGSPVLRSPVLIFPRVFDSLRDAMGQLQPVAMERIA
jgi:hypothetical protein